MEKKPFTELGLSPAILQAVAKMGFEEASPIQSAAIPPLLKGCDLVGQSHTGSGKTAAFGIPAIELIDLKSHDLQVLILCPTRELAVQVTEEINRLAAFSRGFHSIPIYGGTAYDRQLRALRGGVQMVIGTPGRVMDHMEKGTLKLNKLKMVILDEADRMLDMGFRDDIAMILEKAPAERQTVFFSATLPKQIKLLINTYAKDPETIQIEDKPLSVPAIEQVYYEVARRSKLEVLSRLIDMNDIKLGIIFCSTKVMVDSLTEHLVARGYSADRLHGDINQTGRERVMNRFRQGKLEFLVATDVAARGIDVENVEVVFNYDLPNDGEDYVHRIGRTGRAGKTGRAITFVEGREIYRLQNIMRFTKMKIRRERAPSLDEVEEKRINVFFEQLRGLLVSGNYKKYDALLDRLLDQGYAPTDISSALIHQLIGAESAVGEAIQEDKPQRPTREGEREGPAKEKGKKKKDRPERGDRPERVDRPERAERPVRQGRAEAGWRRMFINAGHKMKIGPGEIVGAITGMTGLKGDVIGAIEVFDKHLFVNVAEDHVYTVMEKLDGIRIKGRRINVELADE
jgi:ATP-dependent RNA helicase DeaD